MALTTYRLTVDLVGIAGRDVSGIAVSVELDRSGLVFPVGGAPVETLYPNHLASKTDSAGVAEFDLLPSSVAGLYKVTVGGFTRTISMPQRDARLSSLGDAVRPEEAGEIADPVARAAAATAESTATDALNRANEAIEDIGDLLPLVTAAANPADATDDEAADPTETGIRSWSSALIARVVRAIVPAWARAAEAPDGASPATEAEAGTVTLARAEDVADSETDLTRVPTVSRAIALIRRLIGENVRSLPEAETSHVGFPLVAVSSRPGADGGWRKLEGDGIADDTIAEVNLEEAVRDKLNAGGAAQDRIVLTHEEGVFYGGNAVDIIGTYHLGVQTAAGAFASAVRAEIHTHGVRLLNDAYDPADLQRTYEYEIDSTKAQNLSDGTVSPEDPRSLLTIGLNLPVDIRIFAAGNVELTRYAIDVPLVAKPATAGGAYTLPQASEAALGGVRSASQSQAQAASGTVPLAWPLNRLKEAIRRNLPAASATVRGGVLGVTQAIVDAGTSTGLYAWNIANLLRLIRTQIVSWARQGDASTIPAAKLGAGARTGEKFLRDDGTWQAPPAGGTPTLTITQRIGIASGAIEPESIPYPFGGTRDELIAAVRREWRISLPLIGELPLDTWVTASLHGVPLELLTTSGPVPANPVYSRARKKLPIVDGTPTTNERLVARIPSGGEGALDAANAGVVVDAIGSQATSPNTGNPGAQSTEIVVAFFDAANGGNKIAETRYSVSLVDVPTDGEIAAIAAERFTDAEKTKLQNLPDAGRPLSLAQQVGLTHANVLPEVITYTSAADLSAKIRRIFNVAISDRAEITSDVWLQADLGTTARVLARHNRAALAADANDLSINAGAVGEATANAAAADVIGGSTLHVDLYWYADAAGRTLASRQRYVIATIAVPPGRFNTAVGVSGTTGNVPAGTETISGYLTKGTETHRYPYSIDIEDIAATSLDFVVATPNPRNRDPDHADSVGLRMTYVPATRTLTYLAIGGNAALRAIRAKGQA